ncbi:hypothetical protein [Acidovorax sp.]|uniref:hypothetical protein n=1 Tax=Acidovorax sp. TaxID=1872122 RepID=UPI002ACDCECB|nr:hypothetical protein [Acidovorax sp.]
MRLYREVFESHAWQCLSSGGRDAYLALLLQKGSTNNGDLSLPITVARRYGIKSEATLAKALRELCSVGLLAISRRGGSTKEGHRQVNLYRFTDYDVYENPSKHIDACKATNEWKLITTLGLGREAIRKGEEQAAALALERKKTLLQKMKGTTSEIEGVEPKTTSKNEVWPAEPLQKMKPAQGPPMSVKPYAATV